MPFAVACSASTPNSLFSTPANAGMSSDAGMSSSSSSGNGQGGEATFDAAGASEPDAGGSTSAGAGAAGKPEAATPSDADAGAGSGGKSGHEKGAAGEPALLSDNGGAHSMSGGGSGADSAGSMDDPVVELKGNASASSSESGNPPGNANDGNPMTRWCESGRVLPVFWQLDLGASHSLSRVELVWEYPEREFYGYTVNVSDDATQFPATPAIDNTKNQSTAKTQVATFAPQVSGRYVRITVTSLPPNQLPMETWASLYEVRVFGR